MTLENGPPQCEVVGILNVTPDSFSDGGRFLDPERAIEHGMTMVGSGATLIDVGGESTRPGAHRVTEEEETRRILPVVRRLAESGVRVSIDTSRSAVALTAIANGAVMVNDVTGGAADVEMLARLGATDCQVVLMHSRGPSATMRSRVTYTDVVTEVCAELERRVERATAAGIDLSRLVLDPGLGFAKLPEHDWTLLTGLAHLRRRLELPLMVGASRKSFLRDLTSDDPEDRDEASLAVSILAACSGASYLRVHDVLGTMRGLAVLEQWRRRGAPVPG